MLRRVFAALVALGGIAMLSGAEPASAAPIPPGSLLVTVSVPSDLLAVEPEAATFRAPDLDCEAGAVADIDGISTTTYECTGESAEHTLSVDLGDRVRSVLGYECADGSIAEGVIFAEIDVDLTAGGTSCALTVTKVPGLDLGETVSSDAYPGLSIVYVSELSQGGVPVPKGDVLIDPGEPGGVEPVGCALERESLEEATLDWSFETVCRLEPGEVTIAPLRYDPAASFTLTCVPGIVPLDEVPTSGDDVTDAGVTVTVPDDDRLSCRFAAAEIDGSISTAVRFDGADGQPNGWSIDVSEADRDRLVDVAAGRTIVPFGDYLVDVVGPADGTARIMVDRGDSTPPVEVSQFPLDITVAVGADVVIEVIVAAPTPVVVDPVPPVLPRTGADASMTVMAAALVGAGLLLCRAARRRPTDQRA